MVASGRNVPPTQDHDLSYGGAREIPGITPAPPVAKSRPVSRDLADGGQPRDQALGAVGGQPRDQALGMWVAPAAQSQSNLDRDLATGVVGLMPDIALAL
jgi:hypothetical protein